MEKEIETYSNEDQHGYPKFVHWQCLIRFGIYSGDESESMANCDSGTSSPLYDNHNRSKCSNKVAALVDHAEPVFIHYNVFII